MTRLLYENSVAHRGYLIIPFIFATVGTETLYSYHLLCESGHRDPWHKAENPSSICDRRLSDVIAIAQEFLNEHGESHGDGNYFKRRYTYNDNLIITIQASGKWFYDHYPPHALNNVAAPKIFPTEQACLDWIKQGLDRTPFDR